MRLRAVSVLLALGVLLGLAVPAGQPDPAAAQPESPVGGKQLDESGVVAQEGPGVPELPEVSASSYVVADTENGRVLAAKDPHGRYRPASTLKVLTALTLIPRLDAEDTIRPQHEDVSVEGSKVGVTTEMSYQVEDLFHGLLLASGNDAALALARGAGGLERTLELMNAKAEELHAYDTAAKTPNGLDQPGQRSSAYDLALIARAAMQIPEYRQYISTERTTFPAPDGGSFAINNHNDLLTDYEGTIGGKTGYTSKAGATYIGTAQRDGRTILITLMHSEPRLWEDATALLDWGFAASGQVEPVGKLVEPGPRAASAARSPAPAESSSAPGAEEDSAPDMARESLTRTSGPNWRGVLVPAALAAVTLSTVSVLLLRHWPHRRYRGRRRAGSP